MSFCPDCVSERPAETCWKCGANTIEVSGTCIHPKLPDVHYIRELAKQVGYAIAEHGSKERDLNLIAVPWKDTAVCSGKLVEHLASGLKAYVVETEYKPHGRVAVSLQINGYYKPIDLSITPKALMPT